MLLLWLSLSSFGVCLASGLVPLINAEVYLVAASAASPAYATVPLLLMGTLGQMVAKVMMYYGAQGALRVPAGRYRDKFAAAAEQLDRWRGHMNSMVFVSACVGLPPFFAVSIFCGMVRYSIWRFVVLGGLGRVLRFSVFVFFPEVIKDLL